MKQVLILIVVVVLAASGAIWFNQSQEKSADKQRQSRAKAVNVMAPVFRAISDSVHSVGTLKARQAIEISSQVNGRVVAVNFKSGQAVTKEDLLIQLDDREIKADMDAAVARVKNARQQLDRARKLQSTKSISQSQVDELRADLDVFSSELMSIKVRLQNHQLTAPFSGRIGTKDIAIGSYLESGDVITTLDAVDPMELVFAIPERFLGEVSEGQTVTSITSAYPSTPFEGELTELGTRIDSLSRTLPARALIPNKTGKLLPGMFMSVRLSFSQREALVIPEQAVLVQGASKYLFVIDGDIAKRKDITLGARDDGYVEVITGIEVSDSIIITGHQRLSSGDKVKLAKEGSPILASTLKVSE